MQGEIGVQSTPGQGSTFWFTASFPLRSAAKPATLPAGLHGLRILCVDDNATGCARLETLLGAWGAEVDRAGSGWETLARLKHAHARPYDLILLDQQMPRPCS